MDYEAIHGGTVQTTGGATVLLNMHTALAEVRHFYATYGIAGEGPPDGFDADKLHAEFLPREDDLKVQRTAIEDKALGRQFRIYREIVEDLASRLTTEELLRELSTLPRSQDEEFDELASGVFWFSLAASLDARHDGAPVTAFDRQVDLPLPMKVRLTVQGSLVLRLYMAFVYMREGRLNDLITAGANARLPCCGRVRKFLNCDYVRRIRNALGHGTFSSTIAGMAFRDESGAIVVTPGFLNQISTWLMMIQLQALAAMARTGPKVSSGDAGLDC